MLLFLAGIIFTLGAEAALVGLWLWWFWPPMMDEQEDEWS